MFSVLLRGIPADRAASVGLAAGLAVARAVGGQAGLKWPNDVQIGGKKVCGILGELEPSGDYVVVGIGINVGHRPGDLPEELNATSLAIEGTDTRRDDLCVLILGEMDMLIGTDFIDEYRTRCVTLSSRVRVELADSSFEGIATGINDDGSLIVDGRTVVAGEVIHVR